MRSTYDDDDDILVIRLSDKPIAREVSQDWNAHISHAEDGTAVEVVVLDAPRIGRATRGSDPCPGLTTCSMHASMPS